MSEKKILLGMLPLWDRLIPPMGISCLKGLLREHGYEVKLMDANIDQGLKNVCDHYFNTLKSYIPGDKRSNFYSLTYDVFAHHLMAYLNHKEKKAYVDLAKLIIYNSFYYRVDDLQVSNLTRVIENFYATLEKYLQVLLDKENPTVFGLSVFSGTLPASLFAFKFVKKHYPHIKTVMGGGIFSNQLANGSQDLDYFLEKTGDYIDKLFIGESEILFLKYLKGELPETQRVYTRKEINEKYFDISSHTPCFDDLELTYYNNLAFYGSRGCPMGCRFCSETMLWGKYRKNNAARIVKGLKNLKETYNYQLFLMTDSLLNPIATSLANSLIKEELNVYWDGYLKVDKSTCDKEVTLLWRRGGFYRARLGLESGSQKILDLMDKNITIDQIKAAISSLAYAGIKTTTYWIIGYPGETLEDFQLTLDLIEELKDDIYEADCNPFWYFLTGQPGSEGWIGKNKSMPLYSEKNRDMLLLQTWVLEKSPKREETYRRINLFVQHCKKIGVPNPYSLHDIYLADKRWKKLQKNAAPMLIEFENTNKLLDECRNVRKINIVRDTHLEMGDFKF